VRAPGPYPDESPAPRRCRCVASQQPGARRPYYTSLEADQAVNPPPALLPSMGAIAAGNDRQKRQNRPKPGLSGECLVPRERLRL
jgi:hypothetical protein